MRDACSRRRVAEFAYNSLEGMASLAGGAGFVLGLGKFIPHPAAKAAMVVAGASTAAGAGLLQAARSYRAEFDRLEAECPRDKDGNFNPPTPPPPPSGGGGGGGVDGGGGGYSGPRSYWEWQPGYSYEDSEGIHLGSGKWVQVFRPIVFDLGANGYDLRTGNDRILVDPDGNGLFQLMSWVGPTDGLLVFDQNQNGVGEFAEAILTSFVPGSTSDLEALRAFDTNGDGIFDANDAEFGKFKVGVDANQDGFFSANEMHSLATFGIESIPLYERPYPDRDWLGMNGVTEHDGAFLAPSVTLDFHGTAYNGYYSDGYYIPSGVVNFASVGFMIEDIPSILLDDGTALISSSMGARSFFWSGAGASISLDSFSYGGHGGIVNAFTGGGNDTLIGSAENNILGGGAGADTIWGGADADLLIVDNDDLLYGSVNGGDGSDTMIADGALGGTISLTAYAIENFIGADHNDSVSAAGSSKAMLIGSGGNDTLIGSDYYDVLSGGAGYDVLYGGAGNDTYVLEWGAGVDVINDASGDNDTVVVDRSFWRDISSFTSSGNDQIINFMNGDQLVITDGRSGNAVESFVFAEGVMSRDDINAWIDMYQASGGSMMESRSSGTSDHYMHSETVIA